MKLSISLLLSIILINIVLASSSNQNILTQLYENEGWLESVSFEDGKKLYQKKLDGLDYQAVMVKWKLDLDPDFIITVVENIYDYNNFLTSLKSVEVKHLSTSDNFIDGYQFYKVPFLKNRHLIFRMNRTVYDSLSNSFKIDWLLLPRESDYESFLKNRDNEANNPVLMDKGEGAWLFEKQENEKWNISYRLYIHPGSWMPGFMVKKANRDNILSLFDDVIKIAMHNNNLKSEL